MIKIKKLMKIFYLILLWQLVFVGAYGIEIPNRVIIDNLEVIISEDAQAEIGKIIQGLNKNPKYFDAKLEKMDLYFPIIERILKEQNIPDEFKYLCAMESSLDPNAVSTSNAVGFWQFKKESAIEVGMKIDHEVDDRKNIVASTIGACKYLKRSNLALNNWIYTTLSYNLGLGGTKRTMESSYVGVKQMTIDATTNRYILKFLAYKILFSNYLYKNKRKYTLLEYNDGGGTGFHELANRININRETLEIYNSWLLVKTIPKDRPYSIIIPVDSVQKEKVISILGLQKIENQVVVEPYQEPKRHWWEIFKSRDAEADYNNTDVPIIFKNNGLKAIQAKKDDNSQKLALQGKVKFKRFLKYNEIRSFDEIIPGKYYYLEKKLESAHVLYHIVQNNERIWDIAQQYGVTIESILQKNKMEEGEALVVGRKLYLKYERPEGELVIIEKVNQSVLPETREEKQKTEDTINTPKDIQNKTPNVVDSTNKSQNQEIELTQTIDTNLFVFHEVMPGQSLFSISKLYQTTLDSLIKWNDLDGTSLKLGQKLLIKKKILNQSQAQEFDLNEPNEWILHTVVEGESLYKISKIYGVTVSKIQNNNQKVDFKVSLGEVLKIKLK